MEPFLFTLAWCWLTLGILAGAVVGLRFDREEWLGGYGSWPRRLMRLGHVAFFGMGMLALALSLSSPHIPGFEKWRLWLTIPLAIGMVGMPSICFLSAWRRAVRHLFFIPVVSLLWAVGFVAVLLVQSWLTGGG